MRSSTQKRSANESRWMRERMELIDAMRNSAHSLEDDQCDMVPPMELLGVYVVATQVAKAVLEGKLDKAEGAALNAVLGAHAFCVLHHCTHESISQGNEKFEKFENTAFRIGCFAIFFDDGYREAHRKHHQSTNRPDDPDLIMSHTDLDVLGKLLRVMGSGESYMSLGLPLKVRDVSLMHRLGLIDMLTRSGLVESKMIKWENMTTKMLSFEIFRVLRKHPEYEKTLRCLQATWRGASQLSLMVLALFFARYPHRNGIEMKDDESSYYDATYRAQGQVDLWMMGEGAHHLHHAKSDVSYARLPKVAHEIESERPDLKTSSRGTKDLKALEFTHEIAPKMKPEDESPMQFPTKRTQAVMNALEIMKKKPNQGVALIVRSVLESALHVVKHADRSFLRLIFRGMKLDRSKEIDPDHSLPTHGWENTILSDDTARRLLNKREMLLQNTTHLCESMKLKESNYPDDQHIRDGYFDLFVSLADAAVSKEVQDMFAKRLGAHLSVNTESSCRDTALRRIKTHLESPIPSNFVRLTKLFKRNIFSQLYYGCGSGNEKETREKLRNMLFGVGKNVRSRL